MPIAQALLSELDHENATTRRVLERVPDAHKDWKPHAKSPTLFWLAGLLAQLRTWVGKSLDAAEFDFEPGGQKLVPPPMPRSTREILERFDAHAAEARGKIAAASDAAFLETWTLKRAGKPLFPLPKAAVVRNFCLNHAYHHRGQLTVYLRMLDVPLPQVYGPTADEPF